MRVGPYRLDGYDGENKVVYEFYGCVYHGCRNCFPGSMIHPLHAPLRMGDVYERTLDRRRFLSSMLPDHSFVEQWECEYISTDPIDVDIQEPIGSRDAWYGGRVDCMRLMAEGDIKYYDINSLYPYVMKYSPFPKGHPKVILSDFDYSCDAYFGLMKAKILAPQNLFHPVLPFRHDSKLLFPLCHTCCNTKSEACSHDIEQRALLGTWCTPEIYEAVREGYRILKIYEVWHYEEKFEPKELFGGYVDTFLGLKFAASGFPQSAATNLQKQAHLDSFYEREGIRVAMEDVHPSVSLRSTAKLILNNLWGRLALSKNKTAVEFIDNFETFVSIMTDRSRIVSDAKYINDDVLMICHGPKESFIPPNNKGSSVIASFVTTYGRLELLKILRHLGTQVCYYDTDSVVFVPGPYQPPCGHHLGQLEDEFPNDNITHFIGLGPKNYCLKFGNGNLTVKCKGISLTTKNKSILNFETLQNILETREELRIDIPHRICRDKATGRVYHRDTHKTFRFSFDKRKVCDDYLTYPYGYVG